MPEAKLSSGQYQTKRAREAFAAQFPTPESKTEFYRELGRKSAAGRIVLSGEEAAALADAYALLGRIAERVTKN
jgi:hypothetical protein